MDWCSAGGCSLDDLGSCSYIFIWQSFLKSSEALLSNCCESLQSSIQNYCVLRIAAMALVSSNKYFYSSAAEESPGTPNT